MKPEHPFVALALAATLFGLAACRGGSSDGASQEQQAQASVLTVETVQPQSRNWPERIQANGPIEAWQEIIVSPETGGLRIAELAVDVGAQVQRGQLLARLSDDSVRAELRQRQASVAQARASLEQARANQRRAQAAAHSGALSEQQIDDYRINQATAQASLDAAIAELDSTQLKLTQTRITAVDDAVVAAKSGVLGNVVATGAELYRLIRQGKLEWKPELDARQLASVRVGQRVSLTLPDGRSADGTVRLVGPAVNASTGRATVYVSLQPGTSARTGMFASGSIALGERPALTLPQKAIVLRDGRAYAWVLDAQDRAFSRVVSTGLRVDGRIEVASGLSPEDRVVADGGAFLSEGAKVTVKAATSQETPR
ncbi:MAG: Multidrug resistance protein MdtA [Paracidovorax wautersii]|uniref:Multidrug resistance protein MdtA n=1 Tax=Paracidovorax wautersii TaxID=1177982 RepID=A0A7V8FN12_9BURK|nr:MAG: Multidrug resistance protein MdtA [Paracidovorax wautersii]